MDLNKQETKKSFQPIQPGASVTAQRLELPSVMILCRNRRDNLSSFLGQLPSNNEKKQQQFLESRLWFHWFQFFIAIPWNPQQRGEPSVSIRSSSKWGLLRPACILGVTKSHVSYDDGNTLKLKPHQNGLNCFFCLGISWFKGNQVEFGSCQWTHEQWKSGMTTFKLHTSSSGFHQKQLTHQLTGCVIDLVPIRKDP